MIPNISLARVIGIGASCFYHSQDSILYVVQPAIDYENDEMVNYIFRFQDNGSSAERSPAINSWHFGFWAHDNSEGRIYAHLDGFNIPNHSVISNNYGDHWAEEDLPMNPKTGVPGENVGECFRTENLFIEDEWYNVLYSTSDSWESWDISFVVENWNISDYAICFGQQNGHLIRVHL